MIYQIVDHDGNVLGEYDDYAEASERMNNLNDQFGPFVEMRNISEPTD